jgi:hypothetical protein
MTHNEPSERRPRYRWPKFALLGLILFVLLYIFWVSREALRIKRQREPRAPTTNAAVDLVPPRAAP